MKKTKLLTSLSALLLVLSVGACDNNVTEDSSSEGTTSEETTTSDSSFTGDTEVSTEGAYALYGDFVDSSWNESPDTSSKYFIPAGTEEYKVTVTIAGEPVDNEWWTDENQWDAGFRVIEYGDYDALVVGSDDLDEASTGVIGSDSEKNIKVNWNTTYYITITFGETPSILVQEELESATDPAGLVNNAALTGNYSVKIQYQESYTEESMTYAEYELALDAYYGYDTSEEAYAALAKYYSVIYSENYVTDYTITIDLYYDTDYILVVEYVDNEFVMLDICVNANDGLWEYMYPYNGGWGYISASNYANYGIYTWEDCYYSLFDAAEDGTADHLVYDETYEAYDFDDWTGSYYNGYYSEASANWFVYLGGEWLMGQTYAWTYAYLYYLHYYTFFDEDDQELTSWYEYAYLYYTDETYTDLCAWSEDIYMTIYDVGETDESETVYYYHDALQASINGSN